MTNEPGSAAGVRRKRARATKTNNCRRPAIRLDRIEDAIGRFYDRFQLSAERIERLRSSVVAELAGQRREAVAGVEQAQKRRVRLQEERHKLLQAHYAGAVPQDMLASEMDRLTRGLTDAETEIKSATKTLDELEATLEQALAAAASCQRQYEDAPPSIRRQINQGFFRRLLIGPGGEVERVEMTEPFAALLADGQVLSLDDAPQGAQIDPDGRPEDGRAETTVRRSPRFQAFLEMHTNGHITTKTAQSVSLGGGLNKPVMAGGLGLEPRLQGSKGLRAADYPIPHSEGQPTRTRRNRSGR